MVMDTGVGMSEEFQTKLFDEFEQEKNDARTQYKGTGLGMPIAKRYVELMGGTIAVESKKGVGTTFTVEIPMELTSSETVEKTKKPAKPSWNCKKKALRTLTSHPCGTTTAVFWAMSLMTRRIYRTVPKIRVASKSLTLK